MKQLDVIIIGTGTAALAAAAEVRRETDNYLIISNGVYGTTCVNAGCMAAKTLIHASELCYQRNNMEYLGIDAAPAPDTAAIFAHLRDMRDHFRGYVLKTTENYNEHIIEGMTEFISLNEIKLGDHHYAAKRIIIATGSTPIIPPQCDQLTVPLLTSDDIFELDKLPSALNVMGLSVLGAEMAQAFARLGCQVSAYHDGTTIGGLSDPQVSESALKRLKEEMDIILIDQFSPEIIQQMNNAPVFVAMSRRANIGNMGLEALGLCKPGEPISDYDPHTMQVKNSPIFIAGDVKLGRSILHEACDEGHIAGYNAVRENITHFRRRVPLQITHTNPTMAVVGTAWADLPPDNFITGEAFYDHQGQAQILGNNCGRLHIYVDKKGGRLLGAELFAPEGEHLAHLLAWMIAKEATVAEALHMPYYHPTTAEGLRSALEHAADQLSLDALSRHGLRMYAR